MEPNNPEPDHLVSGRLEKHHRIVSGGGYPDRFERSHLAAALHTEFEGLAPGEETDRRVGVAGRLMLHRSFGKLQFGTLQDASGSIQLLVDIRSEYEEDERPIVVSGCVGPRGDGYVPDAMMSAHEAAEYHDEQIAVFAETAAEAPVRISVWWEPSQIASGKPVSGSV